VRRAGPTTFTHLPCSRKNFLSCGKRSGGTSRLRMSFGFPEVPPATASGNTGSRQRRRGSGSCSAGRGWSPGFRIGPTDDRPWESPSPRTFSSLPGREVLDEEADRRARRPWGVPPLLLLHPGGAGDVEVDPRRAAHELLEEAAGRDGPGLAAADVLQLPDLAFDLLEILLVQRQLPRLLSRRGGGRFSSGEHPAVVPIIPMLTLPSATMQAPVSVAASTISFGLYFRTAYVMRRRG